MGMMVTTLALAALTVLLVLRHLVRTELAKAPDAAAPPCARCRSPVPKGSISCPGCGAPPQIFEIVAAPAAAPTESSPVGPPHAVVRADLCVGCGTCVDACPEAGAIALQNKVARVDRVRCKGHGTCAASCPVSAIVVTTGAAVQRVQVPRLSSGFETNVPGLYIVGELGGRGLIKNAINEGKIAVEHAAGELRKRAAARETGAGGLDLIIVGSGPAGLSAALEAKRQGLRFIVLEQGTVADTIRKYPRKKLLLAEPTRVPLYGDLWLSDGSKEDLLRVWETVIESAGLPIQTGQRVEQVARHGDLLAVTVGGRDLHARKVILAIGRRGTPRRLGVPGEELEKVFYDIAEMDAFRNERVLVVGGGDSAVESALGLANQPGTQVTLSYRNREFARVKKRNLEKLSRAVDRQSIRLCLESKIREIRPDSVLLDVNGGSSTLPNDDVIVRIGGIPPTQLLERIGIEIIDKDVPLNDGEDAGAG